MVSNQRNNLVAFNHSDSFLLLDLLSDLQHTLMLVLDLSVSISFLQLYLSHHDHCLFVIIPFVVDAQLLSHVSEVLPSKHSHPEHSLHSYYKPVLKQTFIIS